jgi:hypothetical protein
MVTAHKRPSDDGLRQMTEERKAKVDELRLLAVA